MSEIISRFGRRVKSYRTSQKLSQEKLAERSGLHPTYIGQVERGEKNCTLETSEKIAEGLGIPLTQLLDELPSVDEGQVSPDVIKDIELIVAKLVRLDQNKLSAISKMIDIVDTI